MTPRPHTRTHTLPTRAATLAAAVAAAALLTACMSLAPPYSAPPLPVPQALQASPSSAAPDASALDPAAGPMPLHAFVREPRLRALLALALEHNRDLRVAVLAIDKARAQYGVAQADLLPAVNATGAGNRTRTADDLTAAGRANTTAQYSATLGWSSYELDFFGRVRSLNDAALQEFLRVGENRRSAQLSLVAEVMATWLTLEADTRRLQLAQATLRTRQQALELTRQSHALGAASGLALAQAQSSADTTRVDAAAAATQLARGRNALALLVGTPVPPALLPAMEPAPLPASQNTGQSTDQSAAPQLPPPAPPAAALLAVAGELPSSMLLRRPDVRAAEHALQASYAHIGAARAAFFPSITLTASVGTASNALSGLFDAGNGTWVFAPQIRLPIFDAGRNRANLRVAEAAQATALAQYEKAIQSAFRDVADALAERATLAERLAAQQSLVEATTRMLTLSQARYRLGADNYLAVLDAQRSLYAAQQTQLSLALAEQLNRVALYKALGGPWDSPPAATPTLSN